MRALQAVPDSARRRRRRGGSDEERLREELEAHLALQTAENVRAGLSPVEARRQALLKFGAVEAIKEDYRDEQGLPLFDDFVQDVRYALPAAAESARCSRSPPRCRWPWASAPTRRCSR